MLTTQEHIMDTETASNAEVIIVYWQGGVKRGFTPKRDGVAYILPYPSNFLDFRFILLDI